MSTTTKNLGIVAPVPKDEWIANKIYEPLNIVRHINATYIAKKENSNIEPNSTTNWQDFWQPLVYDGIAVIEQETGDSTTSPMSQKATTDELNKKASLDKTNTFTASQIVDNANFKVTKGSFIVENGELTSYKADGIYVKTTKGETIICKLPIKGASRTGSIFVGETDADGRWRIKVITPTENDDAASKEYVDSKAKTIYKHDISFCIGHAAGYCAGIEGVVYKSDSTPINTKELFLQNIPNNITYINRDTSGNAINVDTILINETEKVVTIRIKTPAAGNEQAIVNTFDDIFLSYSNGGFETIITVTDIVTEI